MFQYLLCLFRGHTYVYIGRVFMGIREGKQPYRLRYGCTKCPHIKYEDEKE